MGCDESKTRITLGWADLYQNLFLHAGSRDSGITVSSIAFGVKNKGQQTQWMMGIEALRGPVTGVLRTASEILYTKDYILKRKPRAILYFPL